MRQPHRGDKDRDDQAQKGPLVGQSLSIDVIGSFTVRRDGTVLNGRDVGTRKARTLLAMLAVNRGRLTAIDRVVDALWGGSPTRRPASDAATLISRLRAALGPDTVPGGRAGYWIDSHVHVDLFDARGLVESAEATADTDRALRLARRALDHLDKGGVLHEWPDVDWAEPARVQHDSLLRRARHRATEAALRLGDVHTARDTAEIAVAADAFDETAYRGLMCAHTAAGEPARALLVYERLRNILATALGTDPAAQTRELHIAILRGTAATAPLQYSGPGN
jgi:DNA-binding SARP family transcriptional activator